MLPNMINQRYCPFCRNPAATGCEHLALAVEAREFVRCCVETCHGRSLWESICRQHSTHSRAVGEWSPEQEDFTWLETAFCDRFLKHLKSFGGLDYEWRTGPKLDQGGFWALLWSSNPKQLWWELKEELDRQTIIPFPSHAESAAWQIQMPR